ncbi:MAG: porin family protein [bacterium]|nr:porin family protein [bacterium]
MKSLSNGILWLMLFCGINAQAQIEVPESNGKQEEKEVEEAILPLEPVKTEVIAFANWSNTSRVLRPNSANDGLFGEPLGIREDEKNLNVWSYGLGFRSDLGKRFMWQGGISWIRNGETFTYEAPDTDSTFAYQTFYNYIAMPLKVLFKHGSRVRVYGGVGLTPQMFFSYRQEQQWTTETNTQMDETIKTKNGYNSFVLSGTVTAGVQLRFNKGSSIFVEPEYRIHLTNSYESIDSYEHFGRAFGVNMGFTYPIW